MKTERMRLSVKIKKHHCLSGDHNYLYADRRCGKICLRIWLLIMALSYFILKEKINKRKIIGYILILVGVAFFIYEAERL